MGAEIFRAGCWSFDSFATMVAAMMGRSLRALPHSGAGWVNGGHPLHTLMWRNTRVTLRRPGSGQALGRGGETSTPSGMAQCDVPLGLPFSR